MLPRFAELLKIPQKVSGVGAGRFVEFCEKAVTDSPEQNKFPRPRGMVAVASRLKTF